MFGSCTREGQPQGNDERGGCFSICHVAQQCRREKLRYAGAGDAPLFNAHYNTSPYDNGFPPPDIFNLNCNPLFGGGQHPSQGFSLSLSTVAASSSAGPPSVQRVGPVPAGPFTGYATILNSSKFLRPAQQLLEETCGGGGGGSLLAGVADGETLDIGGDIPDRQDALDGMLDEHRRIKSRLILMLDEVVYNFASSNSFGF